MGRARRRPSTPTPAARDARRRARRRRPAAPRCSASPPPGAARSARRSSAITGSTGKTSTKDILAGDARASTARVVATRAEPQHRDRAAADRARRARRHRGARARDGDARRRARSPSWPRSPSPTSASSSNVGPVHLELLGSIEAIAAAKAELIAGLRAGRRPRSSPPASRCSTPHRRDDVATVTFGPGGDVDELPGGPELPFDVAPTCAATRSPRSPPRAPSASSRDGPSTSRCRAARPADRARPGASSSSTTATTPTRCRCAPPSTTSPRPRPGAASPCSGTCSSSGPTRTASTRRSARTPATAGVDLLVTVGPLRRASADGYGEAHRRRRRRARPPRSSPACSSPATPSCQGLARRRPRGRRRGAGSAPDGRGPHRGHRRAAHLHLPVRRSSSRSCATREFGQHIREEGPEGHHEKAGTPTMGGIIIFTAISVPFLILSDYDWRSVGVFGVGDRLRAARLRRRLHEDRPAPLARPAGADEARRDDRDLARAVVGRDARRRACPTRCACARSTPRSTSASSTRCSSTSSSRARRAR